MTQKLTAKQLRANAVASIRDFYTNHRENVRGMDLATPQTFHDACDVYLAHHRAVEIDLHGESDLPRYIGRTTAYALYREIMSSLAEAADCDRRAERLLREALVERLRLRLEYSRLAHQGAYNAWRAAAQDLAAMEGGAQ